jgi:hypothetical protein
MIAVTRWIPDDAVKLLAVAGEVKLSHADRPLTPTRRSAKPPVRS